VERVPIKARSEQGTLVNQPDVLGASIFIPKARRSEADFLGEVLSQLSTATGYQAIMGTVQTNLGIGTADLGADNVSARELLSQLAGTSLFWEFDYDPENGGRYVLNLGQVPRTPSALNAFTMVPASRPEPTGPGHIPTGAVLHRMSTTRGRMELQSKLAQAGYYTGEPNGQWDTNTIEALKKFQGANNLPITGRLDPETIRKLGIDIALRRTQ
jgi:hypothetical protein